MLDWTVHPHGRGDNGARCGYEHTNPRFTPTGVGTTHLLFCLFELAAVHPHGRGDNPPYLCP